MQVISEMAGEQESIVKEFKDSLKGNLLSIIVYGMEYEKYFVVLRRFDFGFLDKNAALIQKWEKKKEIIFMMHSEIGSNIKIFPLEFLNMKMGYTLLYGKNVLNRLKFRKADVARELRFYIRSKLINLRKGYISVYKNRRNLSKLVMHAFPTLMPVCCGIFFLKKESHPAKCSDMLFYLSSKYDIDLNVLNEINHCKGNKLGIEELKMYVKRLIILLESLYGLLTQIAEDED